MKPFFFPDPVNDVYYITSPKTGFEEVYLRLRTKEQRVHDDQFVKNLPVVPVAHPHAREWKMRQHTQKRFCTYLAHKNKPTLLDIGCGNGWFTSKLAPFTTETVGLDVGKEELEQAARCFGASSLSFVCCTDLTLLPDASFDLITFNASVQYFELTTDFWNNLFRILKPGGEIHLLDSPFYHQNDQQAAKERSERYFSEHAETTATNYYFHHAWEDLPTSYSIQWKPTKWLGKLFKNRSPFAWVVVKAKP